MINDLDISVENGVGILTLNRPKAINALTRDMILGIGDSLRTWAGDEAIRMVLFEGKGARGFCAGGDVRWTRDVVLSGDHQKAFDFFALEYEMNWMISTFDKPIVALTHGVVMGGGIGVAGHAKYRLAHENARFAMPEAAIGYFCDVGARALLASVPRHLALMFMLCGNLVGVGDAIALNLCDAAVRAEDFVAIRQALIEAANRDDIDVALGAIIANYAIEANDTAFCALADSNISLFESDDCARIYSKLKNSAELSTEMVVLAQTILSRCPTSNWVHVAGLDAARENPQITNVLEVDLKLAHLLAVRKDFIEGVRAVLIDKDHAAQWVPDTIGAVDGKTILAALSVK